MEVFSESHWETASIQSFAVLTIISYTKQLALPYVSSICVDRMEP